jgi:DNA-binding beta-propeller fold protein YncE
MGARAWIALMLLAGSLWASALHAQPSLGILYWLDTNFGAPTLNKADAVGNAIASIALGAGTLPEGLACDASGNVYWTEAVANGARIQRAAPNFGNIETVVSGSSTNRGIAVDAADGKLYWTTSNLFLGSLVRSSTLNGGSFTTLIMLGSGANPRGVAVDHAGGKLYWADFDQNALYRANLDGSGMELFQQLIAKSRPYGVAIDAATQEIFWTEYQTGRIRRELLVGGAITTVISGLANPTYLVLDPFTGQMFWSEGGAGAQSIYRGSSAGGPKTSLGLPLTTYGGLAFIADPNVSAPPKPSALPVEFALAPLSPNPSRGLVRGEFAVPRESQVRVSVIDLQGREMAILADGTFPAGRHELSWNAGRSAPAGIYFVRMVIGGRAWMRRLVRAR